MAAGSTNGAIAVFDFSFSQLPHRRKTLVEAKAFGVRAGV
jgi:hypothetical protein